MSDIQHRLTIPGQHIVTTATNFIATTIAYNNNTHTVKVTVENSKGESWLEDWNVDHVIAGFSNGTYAWINETKTYVYPSNAELDITNQKLKDVTDAQCSDGNWDYDPYMQGLANGLILAKAIIEDVEPKFLDAPDVWGFEKTGKPYKLSGEAKSDD